MGFDAIWISPIVKNIDGGYHGYWLSDLWQVNDHFGSERDLKNLVDACHERNMYVMVDVVFNHVGPIGTTYTQISPFNQSAHYHPVCQVVDFNNQTQVEICRLANLPDLNQSNPFVYSQLTEWVAYIVNNFAFDGIRLDTVPYISKDFYKSLMSNVIGPRTMNTYIVGEVFDGRIDYAAGYANIIGATLNYPMYFTLKSCYGSHSSLFNIRVTLEQSASLYKDPSVLGIFIDNHDNARFLHDFNDWKLYQNALTFVLFCQGVPIIYYGTEQGFNGGNDPNNREILWNDMNVDSYFYQLVKTLVSFRKYVLDEIADTPHVERYVEDNFYAFSRGQVFIATTNNGGSSSTVKYMVDDHDYSEGQVVCNIFYPNDDCVQIQNGQLEIVLVNGESKVFYPKEKMPKVVVVQAL